MTGFPDSSVGKESAWNAGDLGSIPELGRSPGEGKGCPLQCSGLENSMDLFKKIRDTKGTLHAKMGSIKDRNGMDLIEAEDIKKRWQEYTELYKKRSSRPR